MNKYVVDESKIGIRLDKLISIYNADISRMLVQKLIEDKLVFVNGKIEKSSYKVKLLDEIIVGDIFIEETKLEAEDISLDIVYEDKDIIIINKQKGLVVHPGNGNKNGTLVNAILNICKDSLSGIGGKIRPGIVHRLDKDTTGLIIVAKNDKAHNKMSNQIKNREVKKTYITIVRGVIKENEATINMPIARNKNDRIKMAVDKNGKEAITHFKVLQRFENYTLLEVNIETGRTHQIRVHLSNIGYPVLGDNVYSNGKNEFNIKGQLLHAEKLEFLHPITNEKMIIKSKLPKEFLNVIKVLEGKF